MVYQRLNRILLVSGMLLFVVACSSIKFMYNQLDWLVPWYIDDYVSLNTQQEVLFQSRLEHYLKWHRTEQLPAYADFLDWTAASAEDGLDETEQETMQRELKQFGDSLLTSLTPSMPELFMQLDDEQVLELFENLEKENDEYREKYIETGEQEQREKRAKEVQKFVERWTGDLNAGQVELIQVWSKKYHQMGADFIASREKWQKQLKQVLQRRQQSKYFQQALAELFSNRSDQRTPQHNEKFNFNEELLKQLYIDLDKSLTQQQRSYMVSKLRDTATDFRELAGLE